MGRENQGVRKSAGRYRVVPRTLIFLTHGGHVLLIKGAPDKKIWPGKYNGIGGHVERDEDLLTAALREAEEETGLRPARLQLCGVVNVNTGEATGIAVFIFRGEAPSSWVNGSREGALEWVKFADATRLALVEDLPTVLPRILSMAPDAPPFYAHYGYDEGDKLLIKIRD